MAFNLADVLKNVPNVDTGREQIVYLPLSQIDEDPNNFYQLTDVPQLADNISLCGLQQPIRVRQKEGGRYIIVSGHRRRAALEMLAVEDPQKWQEVPCIVERDAVSPSLQQLRLIYANASTRKMSPAETATQAGQVTELLYKLKEEGYEFPGRMRDHVAEAMNISKSKLARLKVIRENLDETWVDAWEESLISESVAYNLAQMPRQWQKILHQVWGDKPERLYADTAARAKEKFQRVEAIQCGHGLALCEHSVTMMEKNCREKYATPCTGCCFDCDSLQICKNCCPEALDKQKELKAVAKKAQQDAKAEQEERERPAAEFAKLVWERIGKARKASGCSMETLYKARGEHYYAAIDVVKQENLENGKGKYGPDINVGFGYNIFCRDLMKIVAVADALQCSVDYLLGRTEDRESHLDFLESLCPFEDGVPYQGTEAQQEEVPYQGTTWHVGSPDDPGDYLLMLKFQDSITYEMWHWENECWADMFDCDYNEYTDGEIIGWIPAPEMLKKTPPSLNDSCCAGISPSGHCGAAAYCGSGCTCCLQCNDTDCNGRCGWIDNAAEVMD